MCAPAACSAEMVGRYVAPLFLAPGFDVQNPHTWPRLNVDVARVVL